MRTLATTVAAILLLPVACGDGSSARGSAAIEGRVLAGPVCPVEIVGSPCPPEPWVGTVRATRADGEVVEGATDDEGRFTLAVSPGNYEVVAVVEEGGPPTAVPRSVSVHEDERAHVDLEVDTGIR